jgi:hypothetical protein
MAYRAGGGQSVAIECRRRGELLVAVNNYMLGSPPSNRYLKINYENRSP